MGFIDGPEDVIELERELLSFIFGKLNEMYASMLARYRSTPLPSLERVPIWDFGECVTRLKRMDLVDDLDPEAERELCRLAEEQHGVAAVFVIGFPLSARPFYTHPRTGTGQEGSAAGFDLLFNGLEITTGGQRLHRRADLETALLATGLAIGLERLTTQILGLQNIREATLYPRDRYHVTP